MMIAEDVNNTREFMKRDSESQTGRVATSGGKVDQSFA